MISRIISKLIRIISACMRRIGWFFTMLFYWAMRVFPIKKNKVYISNYYGKGFGDNAKYICVELLKSAFIFDIVWVVNDYNTILPKGIRKVKQNSIRSVYELCTSGVWIDNCRKPLYVRKRNKQFYIQVWHGDFGLKRVEKDAIESLSPSYVRGAINDAHMTDIFVIGSDWAEDKYRNAMWYNGPFLKCGCPRWDILFNMTDNIKERVRRKLNIGSDSHIVLYAPTFRKQQKNPDLSVYSLDWNKLLATLKDHFEGEWIGIIRLHPNISEYSKQLALQGNVIDATDYPDMQELLAISDVCISDYSSSLFEFAINNKPAFIYAVDYPEYKMDRNVYFELEELPFPIAFNMDQLIINIQSFCFDEYIQKNKDFYSNVIGVVRDGNASKKVSELIIQQCYH